ncbi:uncharacterized protein LOC120634456 [Pararge aegeria]|uniref:uncharacterized protein LOC120634456 n=1 Tax=Pararge aegeria TaxID=116150 RepID=UPI0019D1400A|nr:uncharacterized protein LOC120634456 [Pararge aegeria]
MSEKIKNVFSRLSDSKAIVRFVREIERHPCLYDQKSLDYSNRDLKRKTWIEIAKKTNSSVADCKVKWTKIRIAYIRTLRPSYHKDSRIVKKPYYLARYLKFITPGKRFCSESCHNPQSTSENTDPIEEPNEKETKDDEQRNHSDDNISSLDETSQHEVFLDEDNCFDNSDEIEDDYDTAIDTKEAIKIDINKAKTEKEHTNRNNCSTGKIEKRSPCCENLECNPRKMFLFSLLPDVQNLSEPQMRSFRRQVIKLIDNVLCE